MLKRASLILLSSISLLPHTTSASSCTGFINHTYKNLSAKTQDQASAWPTLDKLKKNLGETPKITTKEGKVKYKWVCPENSDVFIIVDFNNSDSITNISGQYSNDDGASTFSFSTAAALPIATPVPAASVSTPPSPTVKEQTIVPPAPTTVAAPSLVTNDEMISPAMADVQSLFYAHLADIVDLSITRLGSEAVQNVFSVKLYNVSAAIKNVIRFEGNVTILGDKVVTVSYDLLPGSSQAKPSVQHPSIINPAFKLADKNAALTFEAALDQLFPLSFNSDKAIKHQDNKWIFVRDKFFDKLRGFIVTTNADGTIASVVYGDVNQFASVAIVDRPLISVSMNNKVALTTEEQTFFNDRIKEMIRITPKLLTSDVLGKVFSYQFYDTQIFTPVGGTTTLVASNGTRILNISKPSAFLNGEAVGFDPQSLISTIKPDFKLSTDSDAKLLQEALDLVYPDTGPDVIRTFEHRGAEWIFKRSNQFFKSSTEYTFTTDKNGSIVSMTVKSVMN